MLDREVLFQADLARFRFGSGYVGHLSETKRAKIIFDARRGNCPPIAADVEFNNSTTTALKCLTKKVTLAYFFSYSIINFCCQYDGQYKQ